MKKKGLKNFEEDTKKGKNKDLLMTGSRDEEEIIKQVVSQDPKSDHLSASSGGPKKHGKTKSDFGHESSNSGRSRESQEDSDTRAQNEKEIQ